MHFPFAQVNSSTSHATSESNDTLLTRGFHKYLKILISVRLWNFKQVWTFLSVYLAKKSVGNAFKEDNYFKRMIKSVKV